MRTRPTSARHFRSKLRRAEKLRHLILLAVKREFVENNLFLSKIFNTPSAEKSDLLNEIQRQIATKKLLKHTVEK